MRIQAGLSQGNSRVVGRGSSLLQGLMDEDLVDVRKTFSSLTVAFRWRLELTECGS